MPSSHGEATGKSIPFAGFVEYKVSKPYCRRTDETYLLIWHWVWHLHRSRLPPVRRRCGCGTCSRYRRSWQPRSLHFFSSSSVQLGFEVMHERNATMSLVLPEHQGCRSVFRMRAGVVCNVTSRDLPTRGSSTFLGSYRIAVGIHLAGCSWFQIAENTIAKIQIGNMYSQAGDRWASPYVLWPNPLPS